MIRSWCHNEIKLLGEGLVYFAHGRDVNCDAHTADYSRAFPITIAATMPPILCHLRYGNLPFFHQKVESFPFCLILGWSCDLLGPTECGKSDTVWLPGQGFKIPCSCVYVLGTISVPCKEAQPSLVNDERPSGETTWKIEAPSGLWRNPSQCPREQIKNCLHGTLLKFLIHKLLAIRYLAVFLSLWVCYIAIGNWNIEEKTSLNNEMCTSFNLEKTHF